jgi:hypothetical protein
MLAHMKRRVFSLPLDEVILGDVMMLEGHEYTVTVIFPPDSRGIYEFRVARGGRIYEVSGNARVSVVRRG